MPIAELLRIGQIRAITRWGDPVLHTEAAPVTDFGPRLQALLADLLATNTAARGAGLAAQQIGVDLAAFVYDCPDEEWRRRTGVLCNPRLENDGATRELTVREEGCLSLPGAAADLARPTTVTCHGQDQYGSPITVTAGGTLGRCLQHESDHTRGIVFGDRLSSRRRKQLHLDADQVGHLYPVDWPLTRSSQD